MNRFSPSLFGFIALLAISCAAQQIPTPFFHAVDTATAVKTLPNFSPDVGYNLLRVKDTTMMFYQYSWHEYVTKPAGAKGHVWIRNVGPGIFNIGPQDTLFIKGSGVTFTKTGTDTLLMTVTGSGDITDVGPAFSSGAAFTDGVVSTGTTMLIWEGTSDDANELNILSPTANPASDINITLPSATSILVGNSTAILDAAGLGLTVTGTTLVFSATELGNTTWLDNNDRTFTFDIAGAGTNPTLGFSSALFTMTGSLDLKNSGAPGALAIYENSGIGTDKVTIQAPADITSSYSLNLPVAQGGANTFLQNDGSGSLSWATAGTGDITAVGPAFSSGDAFVDGTASTGTLMLVWEGTTVNTAEFNLYAPSANPGADIDIIFPASTATLATIGLTETLTNKTLTSPILTTPSISGTASFTNTSAAALFRLYENDLAGTEYITVQAPNDITATYTLTLPLAQGGASTFLQNDGSGNLSWASGGSGDITSVGNVTSGAAFDGTQGTILTFNNAGGDGTFQYDGSNFLISHGISTSLQHAFLVKPYNTGAGNTGQVEFWELAANGTNSINVKAPDAITSDRTVTWPDAAGEISLLGQSIDLSGSEATGTLAAARFGTLTGDVTTAGGSYATTIADNSVDGTDIALGSDAQGDVMYYDGTNWARLGAGNTGEYLQTQGAGANPIWAAVSAAGDITAVGPFASGDAFVDGTASSGTDMLIWEGTTVNAFELRLKSPSSNPASDIDITLPSATATLATIALTETLTNKTLTSPIISVPSISGIASFTNTSNPAILRLYESDLAGTEYIEIQAPNDATATYTLVLPLAQGGASTFLQNNGSGTLSWASAITSLTAGNYIDVSGSTIDFDPTEVGSVTWGSGSDFTWTFNGGGSSANDPNINFTSTGSTAILNFGRTGTDQETRFTGFGGDTYDLTILDGSWIRLEKNANDGNAREFRLANLGNATFNLRVDDTAYIGTVVENGSAVPNATDKLSFFAATTSSELAGVLSDETGSGGGFVRATSPTIATPTISGDLNAIVIDGANSKTLTESSATSFVRIDVSADSFVGGQVFYTVYATDGADYQVRTGSFNFSIYNTSGPDDEYITIGTVINEAYVSSTGTLTVSFTGDTSPTNGVNLQANATASIGQSTLQIKYRVMISSGTATVTGL